MIEKLKTKNTLFTFLFGILSLLVVALSYYFRSKTDGVAWDGTLFDISSVNWLDRTLAHPFNKSLHSLGTITCILLIGPLPYFFAAYIACKSEHKILTFIIVLIVYYEALAITKGAYDILKVSVCRIRPFMYFENPSPKAILDGDWRYSWPSGHTSNVFLAAGFYTSTLLLLKDKSSFAKTFIVCTYIIAAVTGILRVLSGNHFPTDVLSGLLLGSMFGYAVPFLNYSAGLLKEVELKA